MGNSTNHGVRLSEAMEHHKLDARVARAEEIAKSEKERRIALSRELRDAEQRIKILLALDASTPTARFKIRPRSKDSESVAIVQFSDWHVEESVKARTVNGLNRFDLNVASHRIDRLVDKLIHLIRLNRSGTKIETLVIQIGGDLMTGFIHDDLVESNTLHPVQAVLWLHDKLTTILRHIIAHSGCPQIICVCNVGNHGRTTPKKRINTRVENSYEWLLYKMMAKQVPEIDWRISDGYFEWLDVFGVKCRFHHGDDIKYMGGVGGLTIPMNKAISAWNKSKAADLDFFGHWHQSVFMRNAVGNGSLIGYSAHALSIKAEFEPPTQNLVLIEKDLGRTGMWPIYL